MTSFAALCTDEMDVEPGDLIRIFRKGYQHWAVYVGLGDVIHLAPPSEVAGAGVGSLRSIWADTAVIKKEKLSQVIGSDRYCVSNKHDSKYPARTPDQIIALANKLEGKTVEYKLFSDNCEHFANFLRYDVPRSDQSRIAGSLVLMAALLPLLL
ncbi:phospholipase A and acyltransferase 3-like [Erythrolamprus reginae]|uniref:phospholipase A and acyltransferase 3-like n=1 Tax=Erythrolamprus reginae TaxID=121349 RepID=UPI00396CC07B